MWRKAMVYLGLGDDADYEDHDDGYGTEPERHPPRDPRPSSTRPPNTGQTVLGQVAPVPGHEEPMGNGVVRAIGGSGDGTRTGQTVTPSGTVPASPVRARPQVVRPIAVSSSSRPHLVAPASFNEAQDLADKFKSGQPVVVNLQEADRELARRLIDFTSGLCYGLGGQMERLDDHVYLVTPAGARITDDERHRLRSSGYRT